MDAIVAFYGEIETHQATMREVQKDANSKHNDLITKYDGAQAQFERKTSEIIGRNEQLHDQIKEHLQRAVGVSLFHAFDTRRRGLSGGKWFWAVGMLVSVAGGALLSWWLATSIGTGGVQPAFFVKLSAVIPVAFAIAFSAKQYSTERRTEEEYAFKSAVSVSLEPYRDLLHRMRSQGLEQEASFVEKLLSEVFDNPVKRIYPAKTVEADLWDPKARLKDLRQLLALAKGIDPEGAKRLLERYGEMVGFPMKPED
jgi:hypothetical protein